MKNTITLFTVFFLLFNINVISAFDENDDNRPYLTDEDMEALELVLPFDVPVIVTDDSRTFIEESEAITETNDVSQTLYHILVLDRRSSPSNSDINDAGLSVVYKYQHGENGYLIVLYKSMSRTVLPVLPIGSRIVANYTSSHRNMIQEYVNSVMFSRHVTHPVVLSQLRNIFRTDW